MKKSHYSMITMLLRVWNSNMVLIMRLTFLICLVCDLQSFAAEAFSQNMRLSIQQKNISIGNLIGLIEDKTDFYFIYSARMIDFTRTVDVEASNKLVSEILADVFKGTGVSYKIDGRSIALTKSDEITPAEQPSSTISGKVTDSTGSPLPGVSVVIKGSSIGTVTDVSGHFSLSNVTENSILQISFVGLKTQEVKVSGKRAFNIILEDETVGIEEVVAVGYGKVKKSDLTGSVSSVKVAELQAVPITSIDQGLVGKSSGVLVTQTSGMPGAIASIRVRGTSSLEGGNEPLYVIDGFPVYNGTGFGSTGGSTRLSGLSAINPSDIESIEILKDASATAIYGSRAANGVVLITTKGGKQGKDRISFEASYGVQRVVKKIDVMNAYEYATLVNEAYTNSGYAAYYDATQIADIKANPEGTNWQNEIFRSAPTQTYQLGFSGGNEKGVYSISVNYFDQDGIILNSDFKRYSGRLNVERNLFHNFKVGTHFGLSKTISNAVSTDAGGISGVVTAALKFNPVQPVYTNKETGTYTKVNLPGNEYANPVATANETVRENLGTRLLGDLFTEWEFLPDLKAKVSFGVDLFDTKFNTYIPSTLYESGGVGVATISGGYTTNWLNENTLSYSKKIGANHSISALAGVTLQRNQYEAFSASSQGFVNNVLEENSLESGTTYNAPSSDKTEWSLLSFLGRVNYSYRNRYLVTLSSRIDGSSRFGKNNKYGFFPSGALAWRLSEEDFIKNLAIFSNLKLRLGYGVTGNQEIGVYNSLATMGSTTYTFGRALNTGFYANIIPNPNLKWEKTAQYDFGFDFGFVENRLRLTIDYYYKKTTDLIYNVPVTFVTGYETALQNVGSIENRGFELSVEGDILTGDFKWTSSLNVSFNRNKVLDLGGAQYKDVGSDEGHLKTGQVHRLIVGKPLGLFYGYVSDGIFRTQEELTAGPSGSSNWLGGRRYKDLSGASGTPDGTVNATYDRTIIGDPNPDFYGGFTNTFSYKGFDLNVFFQYSVGNDIFNYNAMESLLPSGGQNVYKKLVDRWSPTNPNGKYPIANTNRSAIFSDLYVEDGSYLKLKTLTLAYTFPGLKLKYLDGLRVYVTGQNLLTFTGYTGYDPEVSFRGASNLEFGEDFGGYPQAKTILFGVKLDIK